MFENCCISIFEHCCISIFINSSKIIVRKTNTLPIDSSNRRQYRRCAHRAKKKIIYWSNDRLWIIRNSVDGNSFPSWYQRNLRKSSLTFCEYLRGGRYILGYIREVRSAAVVRSVGRVLSHGAWCGVRGQVRTLQTRGVLPSGGRSVGRRVVQTVNTKFSGLTNVYETTSNDYTDIRIKGRHHPDGSKKSNLFLSLIFLKLCHIENIFRNSNI